MKIECDESQKLWAQKQVEGFKHCEMNNELGIYVCIYCERGSRYGADSQIFASNRRSKKKFNLDEEICLLFFALTVEIRAHLQTHPNKLQYCADSSNNFKVMRLAGRNDLQEGIIKFCRDLKELENNEDVLKIQY